ncbi:hypothetical protein Tco_1081310 [Tanacetum coccineum]|uniref:Uncharacterized protein n=1 Tax=Tanacetum coccineum TaxID=301880 RepID=A0ABQ5HXM1_9ASTR
MENGIVELYFVWTEYQLANIFTKPSPRERFNFLINKLGMRSIIPRGLKLKEETFQVVLDALALTPCYPAFLITADVPEICPRVHGHDFDALPSEEDTISFLRDISHTGVINSLNDVVIDQMHQPWRTFAAIINRSLSGKTKMKESKAYKTYFGYATGEVPLKVARKIKKASPSKKEKSLMWKQSQKERKKEKVDVAHGKGIELLSKVALFEKAQIKEVRKKSLGDFHMTHPSGSSTVAEKPPSVEKITPTVISEGTGDKPGVPDVTNDDSFKSESGSEEQESDSEQDEEPGDDDQEEEEFDQENESKDDEMKSDEEQGMNDTTDQFDDDADARLEEPTKTTTGIVQGEGNDTEMTEAQQGNENLETTQEQVVEDAHVTISTVPKKREVPVTSSSRSSNLASKFLTLEKEVADLKKDHLYTQVTSLVDSHLDTRLGETRQEFMNFLSESLTARIKEQVKDQMPQILPQEVSNFAPPVIEKLIKESHDEVTLAKVSSQPQSTYKAASTLTEFELKKILLNKIEKSESYLTAPEHQDCYDGLKKSYALDKDFFYSYDAGNLGDNKDEPRDETASRRDWFNKPTPPQEPIDPDWNVGKTTKEGPTQTWLMNLAASNPTNKSLKVFDELMSTPIDFSSFVLNVHKIKNLTQEILLGPTFRLLKGTRSNYAELKYDFEECYKALSEKLD